jgi:two-component system cell cycle sensor histidine kinase/response regulator CckA
VQLDVNAEIRRMSGIVGGLLGADVEVDLDLTSDPTTVLIDVVGFEQTLTNLIMNARAAMPRGGTVTIATAVEEIEAGAAPTVDVPSRLVPGSYVRLTVADTGTGIDPDDLPRVFDPYFTTRSSEKGTGLGLATVYATITRSRGAVNVSSDLGHGATFDVWLPVAGNGSGPRPTTKENGRGTVGHGDGTKR